MKTITMNWFLWLSIALGLLLIVSVVFSHNEARPIPSVDPTLSRSDVIDARKTLGEAISQGENELLTVLGLQMGIVAFAATMVFGKDFHVQKAGELFGILIFLVVILGLLYLHLYKGYLGTYVSAVQLESTLPSGLRSYQQIYQVLEEPQAPWPLRPVISLTNTFYIISFLPVYVVITATVGFGRKLNIRSTTIWAINILTTSWSIAYLLPVLRAIATMGS
jgi:uncharacterized membrane protein YedE/YeeE